MFGPVARPRTPTAAFRSPSVTSEMSQASGCSTCGRPLDASNAFRYAGKRICAGCMATATGATEAELLAARGLRPGESPIVSAHLPTMAYEATERPDGDGWRTAVCSAIGGSTLVIGLYFLANPSVAVDAPDLSAFGISGGIRQVVNMQRLGPDVCRRGDLPGRGAAPARRAMMCRRARVAGVGEDAAVPQ